MRKGFFFFFTIAITKALGTNTGGLELGHTYFEVHDLATLSFG